MNLSMQIGRAIFALGLSAGACAFAQSEADADAHAPAVAYSRLEIAPDAAAKEARWVVASVRVGAPLAQPRERTPHVALRDRAAGIPRS